MSTTLNIQLVRKPSMLKKAECVQIKALVSFNVNSNWHSACLHHLVIKGQCVFASVALHLPCFPRPPTSKQHMWHSKPRLCLSHRRVVYSLYHPASLTPFWVGPTAHAMAACTHFLAAWHTDFIVPECAFIKAEAHAIRPFRCQTLSYSSRCT